MMTLGREELFQTSRRNLNYYSALSTSFKLSGVGFSQIFMTNDDSGQRGALSDISKESQLLLCTFHFLQAVWRWLFNVNNNKAKQDPQIFMTNDDSGQRGALSDISKESQLLLCTFHFLQAVWRWLFNVNNNINKEDLQHLMGHFQKLVYSGTEKEILSAANAALNDKLNVRYPNYHEYLKRSLKRHQEWALCCGKNLLTRGNNTDNYTESMINIFKSVILHRIRAYNLIELFKFITEDLEMYFKRKLLALAFGKTQNLHLAPKCFDATGLTVQLSAILQSSSDPCKFLVPSRSDSEVIYKVDCQSGICSCPFKGAMATPVHVKLLSPQNMALQELTAFPRNLRKGLTLQNLQLETIRNYSCRNLFICTTANMPKWT